MNQHKIVGNAYEMECGCIVVVSEVYPHLDMVHPANSEVRILLQINEWCEKNHHETEGIDSFIMTPEAMVEALKTPSYGNAKMKFHVAKTMEYKPKVKREYLSKRIKIEPESI